jgi:hypothetical protein
MKLKEAFEIVLDLAQENVIDGGEETAAEEMRQRDAIEMVEEFASLIESITKDWGEAF